MATRQDRSPSSDRQAGSGFNGGGNIEAPGRIREAISQGINDLGGIVRLAIGTVEDLLDGRITIGEAGAVNTSVGRVLKAVELQLRFAHRNNRMKTLSLPGYES